MRIMDKHTVIRRLSGSTDLLKVFGSYGLKFGSLKMSGCKT